MLFILGFMITLALICMKLREIRESKRWLLPASFALYGGWLFIATVVNSAAALIKLNWSGFGLSQETWGPSIMLVVAIRSINRRSIKNSQCGFSTPNCLGLLWNQSVIKVTGRF